MRTSSPNTDMLDQYMGCFAVVELVLWITKVFECCDLLAGMLVTG